MLRAVYVRTLKPGVTDDEYVAAWMPDGVSREDYPAEVQISHSTTHERQTVTTFEIDVPATDLLDALGALVHPAWRERVAAVVESTEIETIYEDTTAFGHAGSPHLPPGSAA